MELTCSLLTRFIYVQYIIHSIQYVDLTPTCQNASARIASQSAVTCMHHGLYGQYHVRITIKKKNKGIFFRCTLECAVYFMKIARLRVTFVSFC